MFQVFYSTHLFILFIDNVHGFPGKQVAKVIEYLFFVCNFIRAQSTFSGYSISLGMGLYHIQNHLTRWNLKISYGLYKVTCLMICHLSGDGDGNKE